MAIPKPKERPIPREVEQLRKHYADAQMKLTNEISGMIERGNKTDFKDKILKTVNQEIEALDKYANDWINGVVPREYDLARLDVYQVLGEVGSSVRNSKAQQIIMRNALGDLLTAHQFVGRAIKDNIRQAGLDAVAMKMTTGDTVKQTKDALKRRLTDDGIVAITDKRGRKIQLDAYANMVARTTTREATNQGTMAGVQELGYDLVQLTSHNAACPVCSPLEGRVYSISGKDKRYPKLSTAFPSQYSTIHPNCSHVLVPYFDDLDDNAKQTRDFSNRPFDTDAKATKTYQTEQDAKRKLRNDMNQWQRYKLTLGGDAPKTLTTFRKWKKEGGDKWQNLESQYRSARLTKGAGA